MAIELFANQPQTTVTAGGTTAPSGGTTETWTVASSAEFPTAVSGTSQFRVVDSATGKTGEIILVTNVSGTTWTVTRGAESTTPVAHTSPFTIFQDITAGVLAAFLQSGKNLSDLGSASTARTNLGLGTAATQASTAFDTSGAAAAAQSAAEAASLPLAGGTMTGPLAPKVVALTDASTVTVNAAAGNVFTLLTTSGVGSTRAIGAPSSPVDGQVIRFRITQAASGGPYAVTWNAAYDFGSGSAPTLTTTASKTDIVAFEYAATNSLNKWCYLGASIPQGF